MTISFGFSLAPTLDLAGHLDLLAVAEAGGLDLIGIQDHPYVADYLDTFVLAATLLARSERVTVFPDVANLPLRTPAMLAKTAAALDLVSAGRFELALGAGGYWNAISRMGVPRLSAAEGLNAFEEAVTVLRGFWRGDGAPVKFAGTHYRVDGAPSGPRPAHDIGIWTGAQGSKALAVTGRIADGWAAPIPSYLPYEKWSASNAIIDDAARVAGRDPRSLRRIAQIAGTITDRPGADADVAATEGAAPVRGDAGQWAALIERLATEQPFTSFVFWPERQSVEQVTRFARDVVPAARALLAGHGL